MFSLLAGPRAHHPLIGWAGNTASREDGGPCKFRLLAPSGLSFAQKIGVRTRRSKNKRSQDRRGGPWAGLVAWRRRVTRLVLCHAAFSLLLCATVPVPAEGLVVADEGLIHAHEGVVWVHYSIR